jgi:hypothetical protein
VRFIWLAWGRTTRIAEDQNLLAKTLLDLTLEVTIHSLCKLSNAFSDTKRAYKPDDFRLGIHQAKDSLTGRGKWSTTQYLERIRAELWTLDHYPSTILRQLQLVGEIA